MPRIELRQITKVFGRRPRSILPLLTAGKSKKDILQATGHTVAIDRVSLTIGDGEVFVVMGESGSGKSTLLRHLNRLSEPTSGELLVDDVDVLSLDARALIQFRRQTAGMVFQHFGLLPHRTVLANAAYGLLVQRRARADAEREARRWLHLVGLAEYETAFPDELSGGMKQRVGLARALATDAPLLLMDEPFSALDPLTRAELQDQLRSLQLTLKKTVVFITHDLDEALRLGDRVALLRDGRLVQVGRPSDIVREPADDYVAAFVNNVNRGRAVVD